MRWLRSLTALFALAWPASASAQIAFGAVGLGGPGTTSIAVPFPADVAAGNLLVLCIGNKYPTNGPSTPSGWTAPANGQGTGGDGVPGPDTGDVYATVFVKVATGSESGSETVTVTSANVSHGWMARYTKTAGTWAYAATNGSDNSSGTAWSVTGAADPEVVSGDMIVVCSARNNASVGVGSNALTQTGVTFGAMSERADNGTTFGDNVAEVLADITATAGTSSAAPVYTATATGNTAGASVFLRIREVSSGCTGGLLLLGAGKC